VTEDPRLDEPAEKRTIWIILSVVFAGCLIIYALVGVQPPAKPRGAAQPQRLVQPTVRNLKYMVEGTADLADITLENADGGTEQHTNRRLPWSRDLVVRPGFYGYISAQNADEFGGTVIVSIEVDGIRWKRAKSSGKYVIASVSGFVP